MLSTNGQLVNISNKLYGKAEFACEKNHRLVSGTLNRYCTPFGWTGKPAFCECTVYLN